MSRADRIKAALLDAGYMLIRKQGGAYVVAHPPAGPMSRDLRDIADLRRFAAVLGVHVPGVRYE
jgi:hypothetical protein